MAKNQKTKTSEPVDLDEAFDGLDDAEVSGRLPKLKGGTYKGLRIDKVEMKDGYYGRSFITEFTLLGSHKPDGEVKHRAGMRLCYTINGFGQKDREHLAFGNLKGLIAAAFGYDPQSKQKWGAIAKECVNRQELIRGRQVEAVCEEIETRGGNPFVRATWASDDAEYEAPAED